MKKILTLALFIGLITQVFSQTDGLTYQAVIISPDALELPGVDSQGNFLPNTTIAIRFTIFDSGNQLEFQEVQITETDEFGRINLLIGDGNHDYFKEMNWDGTPKDLRVEIDFDAGTNFETMSRERLTFLPYAFHRNITATGTLTVDDRTFLNGELQVEGPTNLQSTLDVNNGNATNLTGSLTVDGETNLNAPFSVNNNSPSNLTGDVTVDGNTLLNGTLKVIGLTTLGDLTVNGEASFGDLEATHLKVTDSTTLQGGLYVNTQSQVRVNRIFQDNFQLDSFIDHHVMLIEGGRQGLAIKLNGGRDNTTNFITFFDETREESWGRIEGELPSEFENNADYEFDKDLLAYDKVSGIIDGVFALNDIAVATGNLIAANSSATGCAGIGACVTVPILSWIISAGAQLALAIVQQGAVVFYIVRAFDNESTYDDNKLLYQGVTYASGAGDYAEYLRKQNPNENLLFGDIVGVYGGTVSKNTSFADKAMVVSRKPIVLGAIPESGTEEDYAKIAFMGQVYVKVFGKVNIGDYIIPSGNNDGIGVAVSPLNIESKDIKNIVGTAWEASNNEHGLNKINVAVGINNNDNIPLIERLQTQLTSQESKIENLETQIEAINTQLTKLLNGEVDSSKAIAALNHTDENKGYDIVHTDANDIIYFEVTDAHIEKSFEEAKRILKENGTYEANKPFLDKIDKDPYFKKIIMDKMKSKIESAFHYHKEIDKKAKH